MNKIPDLTIEELVVDDAWRDLPLEIQTLFCLYDDGELLPEEDFRIGLELVLKRPVLDVELYDKQLLRMEFEGRLPKPTKKELEERWSVNIRVH